MKHNKRTDGDDGTLKKRHAIDYNRMKIRKFRSKIDETIHEVATLRYDIVDALTAPFATQSRKKKNGKNIVS